MINFKNPVMVPNTFKKGEGTAEKVAEESKEYVFNPEEGNKESKETKVEETVVNDAAVNSETTQVSNNLNTSEDSNNSEFNINEELDEYVPAIAELIFNKGLLRIPEGMDTENNFGVEEYIQSLEHTTNTIKDEAYNEGVKETQKAILDRVSPSLAKALNFNINNPNATDEDILQLLQQKQSSEFLMNLDMEKDSERIVREYYNSLSWSNEAVEDKILNLVSNNLITKEAETVKPLLDTYAKTISSNKEQEFAQIREYEASKQEDLKESLLEVFEEKNLYGIPLNKQNAGYIYNALMNNEIPVQMGNKKVHMGYAEALLRQKKYSGKPEDLKNTMLAVMVLNEGPDAVMKYLNKKAETKVADAHVKSIRFGNKSKLGHNSKGKSKKEQEGNFIKF